MDLLTTQEVQEILHVDRTTIYRMIEGGHLPAVRVGKQWRFPRGEVERWLRSQAAAGAATATETQPAAAGSASLPLANLLPAACVQAIQDAFADALEVMIVVTDMQGRPVTQASNPCGLYEIAIRDAEALARCVAHWQQMAGVVPLEPKFTPGDLGLLCARGLIRVGNELKGMVFFGGIAPEAWPPSESEAAALAQHFGLDPQVFAANVDGVHRLDRSAQAKALRFVQRLADILAHIAEDRSEVQGRLQAIASLTAW